MVRTFGFPNGMAATQRLRLMARALVEQGIDVTVLVMWVSEQPPVIENTQVRGEWHGVRFEYTTGTTIRPRNFFARRWIELRGIVGALRRVIQFRRARPITCLYLYDAVMRMTIAHWLFILLARWLRVPIAVELNERPWSMRENATRIERAISPLRGVQGAIVISDFLNEWVSSESARNHFAISVIQLPILVDVNEFTRRAVRCEPPVVLYAASPTYDESLKFILDAMSEVWQAAPQCRLVITGNHPILREKSETTGATGQLVTPGLIEQAGYLTRPELLEHYASASVLLIPLFDDVRSRARFPTKIGEYLAAGRPVVTNRVGEVARCLEDGINAFVCEPGDARLYGQTILKAIQNPARAHQIGLAGRETAERFFHYAHYQEVLAKFFELLN
jgi:glycosyltransferase involved in cell wall biosynthesis